MALGDELQDLALARRHPVKGARLAADPPDIVLSHGLGHWRAEIGVAARNDLTASSSSFGVRVFEQVTGRADVSACNTYSSFAYIESIITRTLGMPPHARLPQAIQPRHGNVQQDHIRLMRFDQAQRVIAVARFCDDFDISQALQQRRNPARTRA
jgi:hypothetical protein